MEVSQAEEMWMETSGCLQILFCIFDYIFILILFLQQLNFKSCQIYLNFVITRWKTWSVEDDSFLVKIRLACSILPRNLLKMIRWLSENDQITIRKWSDDDQKMLKMMIRKCSKWSDEDQKMLKMIRWRSENDEETVSFLVSPSSVTLLVSDSSQCTCRYISVYYQRGKGCDGLGWFKTGQGWVQSTLQCSQVDPLPPSLIKGSTVESQPSASFFFPVSVFVFVFCERWIHISINTSPLPTIRTFRHFIFFGSDTFTSTRPETYFDLKKHFLTSSNIEETFFDFRKLFQHEETLSLSSTHSTTLHFSRSFSLQDLHP